jgi:spore coat polysaccharide biosynthesis predicted glycosyltransferase SpsG
MPVSAKGFFIQMDVETNFKKINFRYDLKFTEIMHYCDLMIIDTSNSTLFEALAVNKPAIVYGGLENVTMAEPVFAMLKNRFLFAETDKKHLMNIHKFIKNPKEFINYFPADINDVSLLKKYIQPVSYKLFWDRIGKNVLFL